MSDQVAMESNLPIGCVLKSKEISSGGVCVCVCVCAREREKPCVSYNLRCKGICKYQLDCAAFIVLVECLSLYTFNV